MQTATIDKWWYNPVINNLEGFVTGHPNFRNGTYVYTSTVQEMNDKICITRNTKYTLGEKCSEEAAEHRKQAFEEYRDFITALEKGISLERS